jgi:hypothetical protein
MGTVIVFFSKSGNTRFAAQELAKRLDAEAVELKERGARKGIFGFLSGGFQSVSGKASELTDSPWNELSGHDTVYLMTPIWAGNTTPAMNGFLVKADLRGKTVHGITFQADPDGRGSEKAHDHMKRRIQDRGGTPGNFYALHSANPGKFAGPEKLLEQISQIRG